MIKEKLKYFKYVRRKQTPSFSQAHTIPEASKLNEFFTSFDSEMYAKIKHRSEQILSRTRKKSIFLFDIINTEIFNSCSNLKNKLRGERWYSKQNRHVFQSYSLRIFSFDEQVHGGKIVSKILWNLLR